MGVSENSGTPKSSILIGFSIINHPFWVTTIFGNTHIWSLSLHCDSIFFEIIFGAPEIFWTEPTHQATQYLACRAGWWSLWRIPVAAQEGLSNCIGCHLPPWRCNDLGFRVLNDLTEWSENFKLVNFQIPKKIHFVCLNKHQLFIITSYPLRPKSHQPPPWATCTEKTMLSYKLPGNVPSDTKKGPLEFSGEIMPTRNYRDCHGLDILHTQDAILYHRDDITFVQIHFWRKSYSYIMLMAEIPNNQLRCFWSLVNNGRFQQKPFPQLVFDRRGLMASHLSRISSPDSNHLKPKGKDPQGVRGSFVTRSFCWDPLVSPNSMIQTVGSDEKIPNFYAKPRTKIINM